MQPKKYISLILFLFNLVPGVNSQPINPPDKSYVDIAGDGLSVNKVKRSANSKVTEIFTVGGSLTIRLNNAYLHFPGELDYHAYFRREALPDKSGRAAREKVTFNRGGVTIYLNPDQEFDVDILDKKNDTLICKYVIKRIKLIPVVKIFDHPGSGKLPLHVFSPGNNDDAFTIPPGGRIKLSIAVAERFQDLEVEYTLVNLKTKKANHKVLKDDSNMLTLMEDTEYELKVNYVLQKESVGIYFIKVRPYWYRSALTYFTIAFVIVAFGFFLVTLVLKNKISHSKKQQQKLEQAAIKLQSMLNPHFTFNALSSIQGLMNTGRIEDANNYLMDFSSLLRQTLAKSQHLFHSLDQELEMMRIYIKLEALRFNFIWDIEIAAEIKPSLIEIPTLLLQPLIENAIKHGLSGSGANGRLNIICKEGQQMETFIIIVKDNGTWTNEGSGYGLSLTLERIRTINKLNNEQAIKLDFDKRSGTEAILTFYNWISN